MLLDISPLRRHRDFRLVFVGQLVSAFGSFFTYVALPVQIFELTHSSTVVGLLGTVQLVPLAFAALWGGAVAWFLLLPLVFTRRSIVQLRGIRVVATTFALMTLGETSMMLLLAPSQSPYVHTEYHFAWGLYSSAVISAVATYVAVRLGGGLKDLRDLAHAAPIAETSDGQPVH